MLSYVRSDSVVCRVIAGEMLIVPVRRGVGDLASIYSLNPVARTIWEAILQPRSQGEIIRLVEEEFEALPETVASDVDAFLSEMSAAGLVTATGAAA